MPLAWETLLLVILAAVDLFILVWIAVARLRVRARDRRRRWMREFLRVAFESAPLEQVADAFHRDPDAFMNEYMLLADAVELPPQQEAKLQRALVEAHRFPALVADLRSRPAARRKRAAIWLSYALPEQAVLPLVEALERETRSSVRLHIAYALVRLGRPAVIPMIVDTLSNAEPAYQRQISGLLMSQAAELREYFPLLRDRQEPEIRRLLLEVAAGLGDDAGRDFLLETIDDDDREIAIDATRMLLHGYIHVVDTAPLLRSEDTMIVNLTLEALGRLPPEESLDPLLGGTADPRTRKSAIVGLARLVHDRPETYSLIVDEALDDDSRSDRDALLEVVSNRVEYLIDQVLREPDSGRRVVLDELIRSGRASGLLGFLNRNQDPDVEAKLVEACGDAIRETPEARDLFATHAHDSVRDRLGLEPQEVDRSRGARVGESVKPVFIIAILAATIVLPAGVYGGVRALGETPGTLFEWFTAYARDFTLFFGFYAFVLNTIYLILLGLAAGAVSAQEASLKSKPLALLFTPRMLPSISIVAPAYNEEATIAESVNSLLNLRYPDFEIIVVNDGSADETLRVLVESFELERADIFLHGYLATQRVRGVYRNPRIPELVVIDKQNGGKADSLNAGINASRKEYFAAIDSDSLLERDSLLTLAARFLDSDVPVVASGGNIFPVNGCRVSRGKLDEIHLPGKVLGRLQTLEYLRSFMAGRTGWAAANSLMIISGAFGLFRKKDVVDAHGYLTGTGHYGKDTVAEDMELVVRVARMLYERGTAFAVQYGYNANCWTEVPTTHRILRNQRDRWQRGLIDTMFYHIRMLGNPRYGTMGLVGFPYFFFFELLGPWIEIQGLVFLITGLALRTMPLGVVSIVFAATIPLGIAVSLSSLLLAEFHQRYYGPFDRVRLMFLAFLEDFGYRQYASVLRLRGYISALTRKTGWGAMVRTGFGGAKGTAAQRGRTA